LFLNNTYFWNIRWIQTSDAFM